eukprot:679565-Amphidinium_carterae.1
MRVERTSENTTVTPKTASQDNHTRLIVWGRYNKDQAFLLRRLSSCDWYAKLTTSCSLQRFGSSQDHEHDISA